MRALPLTEDRTEKQCNCCAAVKPIGEFYRRKLRAGGSGRASACKVCADKKHEIYIHKSYVADYATVPPKPHLCELCRDGGKICLDHDHVTGKFRGWLCDRCNRAIGLLKDSPALVRRALEYLRKMKTGAQWEQFQLDLRIPLSRDPPATPGLTAKARTWVRPLVQLPLFPDSLTEP